MPESLVLVIGITLFALAIVTSALCVWHFFSPPPPVKHGGFNQQKMHSDEFLIEFKPAPVRTRRQDEDYFHISTGVGGRFRREMNECLGGSEGPERPTEGLTQTCMDGGQPQYEAQEYVVVESSESASEISRMDLPPRNSRNKMDVTRNAQVAVAAMLGLKEIPQQWSITPSEVDESLSHVSRSADQGNSSGFEDSASSDLGSMGISAGSAKSANLYPHVSLTILEDGTVSMN